MAERSINVEHATIDRWVVRFSLLRLDRFNQRKRAVTGRWHVDETYIKVRGRWMDQYRVIDSLGDMVELWFSEQRDLLRPSASSGRRSNAMAGRRGPSSTAAGPTTRRSSPVIARTGCVIGVEAL